MEEIGGRKEEGKAEGCHYTIISKSIINKKKQDLNPMTNLFSVWMTCSERLKHFKMW